MVEFGVSHKKGFTDEGGTVVWFGLVSFFDRFCGQGLRILNLSGAGGEGESVRWGPFI